MKEAKDLKTLLHMIGIETQQTIKIISEAKTEKINSLINNGHCDITYEGYCGDYEMSVNIVLKLKNK